MSQAPRGRALPVDSNAKAAPVATYEALFADAVGAKQAFAFFKGRVALYAILKALGVKPGDRVVFPGFTCVMVPNAALYLGATPVYVDIDPATYGMDPEALRSTLRSMRPCDVQRVKAVVAQHTFGIPAEMDELRSVASHYGIPVVEDCAHALGSTYKGRQVGTLGDAAFFSSQWSKPYSTGLGGVAVTSNTALATRIAEVQASCRAPPLRETALLTIQNAVHRELFSARVYWLAVRTLSILSKSGVFVGSSYGAEYGVHMPSRYGQQMGASQARSGAKALSSYADVVRCRRRLVDYYESELATIRSLRVPATSKAVLLRYPVRVTDKSAALTYAKRHSVELGGWFESVLHPVRDGLERLGYMRGMCPEGEIAASTVVNLPTHPRVLRRDARQAVAIVTRYVTR